MGWIGIDWHLLPITGDDPVAIDYEFGCILVYIYIYNAIYVYMRELSSVSMITLRPIPVSSLSIQFSSSPSNDGGGRQQQANCSLPPAHPKRDLATAVRQPNLNNAIHRKTTATSGGKQPIGSHFTYTSPAKTPTQAPVGCVTVGPFPSSAEAVRDVVMLAV